MNRHLRETPNQQQQIVVYLRTIFLFMLCDLHLNGHHILISSVNWICMVVLTECTCNLALRKLARVVGLVAISFIGKVVAGARMLMAKSLSFQNMNRTYGNSNPQNKNR